MSDTSKVTVYAIDMHGGVNVLYFNSVTGVIVGDAGQLMLEYAGGSTRCWARGNWAEFFETPGE